MKDNGTERKIMMRKSIDRENLKKFLLISNLIITPDPEIFSLYTKRRKYQVDAVHSRGIQQYWKHVGNYLRHAMLEVESQVDSQKELADG
jgi:hypothetical protein